jgi:hypothetical protein
MADRDLWDRTESASRILAAVLIPVVLAVAGYVANGQLEKQRTVVEHEKLDQDMLNRAIEVVFFSKEKEQLFGNEVSLESRRLYRAHWIATYNEYARIKLAEGFVAMMMEQNTDVANRRLVTAEDKPMPANEQNGDGWVAVGKPGSPHYADVNFEIPHEDLVGESKIRPGAIIRARWSVNLRKNTHNTEAHAGLNEIVGVIQAGACARVLKSEPNIRSQTWASIEVVPCGRLHEAVAPGKSGSSTL